VFEYHVDAFVPPAPGCGKADNGWDPKRCQDFAKFLNGYATEGWRLQSCEYRTVAAQSGCGPSSSSWLVCIFERSR
jgi:hypothetical protein